MLNLLHLDNLASSFSFCEWKKLFRLEMHSDIAVTGSKFKRSSEVKPG